MKPETKAALLGAAAEIEKLESEIAKYKTETRLLREQVGRLAPLAAKWEAREGRSLGQQVVDSFRSLQSGMAEIDKMLADLDKSAEPAPTFATRDAGAARPGERYAYQMSQGAVDVIAERREQVTREGWTPDHDDLHKDGALADAARAYLMSNLDPEEPPYMWPWPLQWWKPTTIRRNLVKAAALIIAEIDRLDRADAKVKATPPDPRQWAYDAAEKALGARVAPSSAPFMAQLVADAVLDTAKARGDRGLASGYDGSQK